MVSLISRISAGVRRSLMAPSSQAARTPTSAGQDRPDRPCGGAAGRDAGRDADAVVCRPAQREPWRQLACGCETRTVPDGILRQSPTPARSEEHTSELQSQSNLVCRLLLEKKKKKITTTYLQTKKKTHKSHDTNKHKQ